MKLSTKQISTFVRDDPREVRPEHQSEQIKLQSVVAQAVFLWWAPVFQRHRRAPERMPPALIVSRRSPPDFPSPRSALERRLRPLQLSCGMNTGAAALSQIQTRYDTASLPIERETWPQGVLPAENVATSKPLGAAHRPKKKGRGVGLWAGDALGIPVSNCMLGDKRTQLKKSLALADRVMRLQAAARRQSNKKFRIGRAHRAL